MGEVDAEVAALTTALDQDRRDVLIAFGWAMSEELASGFKS
jgi:hypothetical protein